MKTWRMRLLLLLAPIAFVAIAAGVLLLQPSGSAEAGFASSDSVSCGEVGTPVDALVFASDSTETSLGLTSDPTLSAACYLVGISVLQGACGGEDLWILRYLCYSPGKGWYYVNYHWCA